MKMVLSTEDIDQISDAAHLQMRRVHRMAGGQQLIPADSIEYWVVHETLKLLNERYA